MNLDRTPARAAPEAIRRRYPRRKARRGRNAKQHAARINKHAFATQTNVARSATERVTNGGGGNGSRKRLGNHHKNERLLGEKRGENVLVEVEEQETYLSGPTDVEGII